MPTAPTQTRRAIGIVRVSETKGREGESFASPPEQRERIRVECERQGLTLVDTIEELDVSGTLPLKRRPGLLRVVEAIEAGEIEVLAAGYFDRLFRSLRTQSEVIERVEAARGQVLAVDVGQVSNGSAAQWLSGTMHGMVAEYQARSARERSGDAQARAVARGVPPWPNVTPGYRQRDDGRYEPDPKAAPVIERAFKMRADGATIDAIRKFLASNGIAKSYHGVTKLLKSRVVLGEIHFGKLVNLAAHDPIVDAETWKRVQRARVPRGRKAKSDRLLARLGVLRCGSCGARMVVGTSNNSGYWIYRCPPTGDCKRRVTISAELVEGIVTERVREALADVEGRASAEQGAREAAQAVERAEADLQAAFRAFAGMESEPGARERLAELREVRDSAQEHLDQLGGLRAAVAINAADDWDRLTLDERRALIRATVERATVAPGRGADRVSVELFGQ